MSEPKIMLDYGKRRRSRWRWYVFLSFSVICSVAMLQQRQRLTEMYAEWSAEREYRRLFDAVSDSYATDLINARTPGAGARADLDRLTQLSRLSGRIYAPGDPGSVLVVLKGKTGGAGWLAFACVSSSEVAMYTFERDDRSAPALERFYAIGGGYDPFPRPSTITPLAVTPTASGVTTTLEIDGRSNRIDWTIAAGGSTFRPLISGRPSRLTTGMASVMSGFSNLGNWIPSTRDMDLRERAPTPITVSLGFPVKGAGIKDADEIIVASAEGIVSVGRSERATQRAFPQEVTDVRGAVFNSAATQCVLSTDHGSAVIDVGTMQTIWESGEYLDHVLSFAADGRVIVKLSRGVFEIDPNQRHAAPVPNVPIEVNAAVRVNLTTIRSKESGTLEIRTDSGASASSPTLIASSGRRHTLSPDGRWFCSGEMEFVDLTKPAARRRVPGLGSGFSAQIVWSHDSSSAAFAESDYIYHIRLGPTLSISRFPHHCRRVPMVALSPDGQSLVAAELDAKTVDRYDLAEE